MTHLLGLHPSKHVHFCQRLVQELAWCLKKSVSLLLYKHGEDSFCRFYSLHGSFHSWVSRLPHRSHVFISHRTSVSLLWKQLFYELGGKYSILTPLSCLGLWFLNSELKLSKRGQAGVFFCCLYKKMCGHRNKLTYHFVGESVIITKSTRSGENRGTLHHVD